MGKKNLFVRHMKGYIDGYYSMDSPVRYGVDLQPVQTEARKRSKRGIAQGKAVTR